MRQSDLDDNYIEIILDGSLANVYEMTAIDELVILAGDGDDLIVIDQTFGEIFAEDLIRLLAVLVKIRCSMSMVSITTSTSTETVPEM